MSNEEDKKNEVMDYGKFFEREKEKKVEIPQKKKKFSFGFLKKVWFETDKKTKIELIVLLVVIIMIIGILTFHFLKEARTFESFRHSPSQRAYLLSQ